jgi:hypothetical protein
MTRVMRSTMKTNRGRYGPGGGYFAFKTDRIQSATLVFATSIVLVGFLIYNPFASNNVPLTQYVLHRSFLKGNGQRRRRTSGTADIIPDTDGRNEAIDIHEYETETKKGRIDDDGGGSESGIGREMEQIVRGRHHHVKVDLMMEKEVVQVAKHVDSSEEMERDAFRDSPSDPIDFGPKNTFDNHLMFHNYVRHKSGSVVEDMLMAHAYIFHLNATYGGCCGEPGLKMTAHEDLLDALGLKGVLKFKCPRDYVEDTETRRSVIPREHYHSDDTRVWTPAYVDYLRSMVTYPRKRYKEYTIVVQMQRGDTSPCRAQKNGFYRYLPNLHYQTLIDKYMKPGARVIIYTTPQSFESLEEFRKKGYEVNTSASLKDTWKDFVTADVMIMSRSDFSMVPAMVAKGTVVYTPFWHHALRRWKRVDRATMTQTDKETERIRNEKCSSGG